MNIFDTYLVLDCHPGLGDAEIRTEHRALSRRYHPDRPGGDQEKFVEVQQAFQLIATAKDRATLRTRFQGLGEPCPTCDERGYIRQYKRFQLVSVQPCSTCRRTGYVERARR